MWGKRANRPGMSGLMLAAVVAACVVFPGGCERSRSGPVPGTLRFNIDTEPSSLDWGITTEHASIRVLTNIMEGLTRFDDDLNVVPALAESWEILDDGYRYVFHLRENARWTDGRPVVAQDFVYSWRRLLDPKLAGEYAYFIYMVKNAEAFNSGKIDDPDLIGVHAKGPHTLEVELERPVVFFPMITTFICTFPMRKDVVEKWGDDWTEPGRIVTCGPYRLKEWRHEYRIVIEANPDYYGGPPGLERAVLYMVNEQSTGLSLYETDDLDALDPVLPEAIPFYRDSPEYYNLPQLACYYYGFNVSRPPVDNPLVRAALARSIDRSQLPEILNGNQAPNPTLLPVGMRFSNTGLGHDFDPASARSLLAEAGYPDGKGFPGITIGYNTLEMHKTIAEFVQQQWRENLGIKVELRNMEWKVFLKELQHDPPHVWRLGWILDYPDPDALMTVFLSNSGNNHTRWHSQEYDQLVLKASLEPDPARRQELYDRAQRIICQRDTAIIPLYTYTLNILAKPWVRNFPMNGQDLLDLRRTRIEAPP